MDAILILVKKRNKIKIIFSGIEENSENLTHFRTFEDIRRKVSENYENIRKCYETFRNLTSLNKQKREELGNGGKTFSKTNRIRIRSSPNNLAVRSLYREVCKRQT